MRRATIAAILVALSLTLTGCARDAGDGQQDTVAELLIAEMRTTGVGPRVNEDCVHEVAGGLSDEAAAAIVDAAESGGSARDEPEFRALEDDFLACLQTGQ